MSKAAKELEAQRLDLKRRWWWLDPAHQKAKCPAALAWETLRRTQSYPALWRKAVRERGAFLGNKDALNRGKEMLRLMHLFQQARGGVGELCCKYLTTEFDPDQTWLELDKRQQLTAQGYLFDDSGAVKFSEAWTLPRQDYSEPPSDAVRVGICELARDGDGKLSVSKRIRGWESLGGIAGTEFFKRLNPGRYLICNFDIRRSREQLSQAWDAKMKDWLGGPPSEADANKPIAVRELPPRGRPKEPPEHWTPDPDSGGSRPKPKEVHLLPSDDPALVILLLPAKYNRAVFRSVFQGQLKREQRDKWLPRCVEFWKTLTHTDERYLLNPDGSKRSVQDVTRRFSPELHLPKETKRGKSGARKNLWLGLAACDVVRMGASLFEKSQPVDFLLVNMGASAVASKDAYNVRRKRSCHQLRNHQDAAEAYLNELDASLGRLDKNLAHWLQQNARLAHVLSLAGDLPLTSKE